MSHENTALLHGLSAPTLAGTPTAWRALKVNPNGGLFALPTSATGDVGTFLPSSRPTIVPITSTFGLQIATIRYGYDANQGSYQRLGSIDVTNDPSFNDSAQREALFRASMSYSLDISSGDPLWWNPFGCIPGQDFQATDRAVTVQVAAKYAKNFTSNNIVIARDLGNDISLNNQAEVSTGLGGAVSYGAVWGGQSWTRLRHANTTTILGTLNGNIAGILAAMPVGEWSLTHAPVANTIASVTIAAGTALQVHVLRSIVATINAVAAIAAPLTVVVRNGASGVGAILWQDRLIAPIGTSRRLVISDLNIPASGGTALTVEFTGAPGATNFETLSVSGWTTVNT